MKAQPGISAAFTTGSTILITPPFGSDLLEEIERAVMDRDLDFCRIETIGSLSKAALTYYDQAAHQDRLIEFDRPLMLLHLVGTALRSSDGMEVHCHLVLGDELGAAFGGDLSPGCIVYSCEMMLQELTGPSIRRITDEDTGLSRFRAIDAAS